MTGVTQHATKSMPNVILSTGEQVIVETARCADKPVFEGWIEHCVVMVFSFSEHAVLQLDARRLDSAGIGPMSGMW